MACKGMGLSFLVDDERMDDEREPFPLSKRERAILIDGLMVLMHQMEAIPENDLSEMPELQALLERLMGTG
jgi:hypothetical protein